MSECMRDDGRRKKAKIEGEEEEENGGHTKFEWKTHLFLWPFFSFRSQRNDWDLLWRRLDENEVHA